MTKIKNQKIALRRNMREILLEMPENKLANAGIEVARHLEGWLNNHFAGERVSAAYFRSLSDEIDTRALEELLLKILAQRALPVTSKEGLVFQRLQPYETCRSLGFVFNEGALLDPSKLDVIFVPGLSFDKKGHRLGRGKGHFDRLLAKLSCLEKPPFFIGLAMDEQVITEVPHEPHDVPMDFLCTPVFGMMATNQRTLNARIFRS